MHHLALLLFKKIILYRSKHCIKERQNAPFIALILLGFPKYHVKQHPNAPITVPIFKKQQGLRVRGLLHASLMRSKKVLFLLMAGSNIVSECVTLITAVLNRFEYRQNAPFSVHVFNMISEDPYRIRCRKNTPFNVLVFFFPTTVLNRFEYRQNAPFSVFFFLFSHYSSKSFRIPSECTIQCLVFFVFPLQF